MKYCGLVVDESVERPTNIGKNLTWDLKDNILCTTNVFLERNRIIDNKSSGVDILNVTTSDLTLILDAFNCLGIKSEMSKLSDNVKELLQEVKCQATMVKS